MNPRIRYKEVDKLEAIMADVKDIHYSVKTTGQTDATKVCEDLMGKLNQLYCLLDRHHRI